MNLKRSLPWLLVLLPLSPAFGDGGLDVPTWPFLLWLAVLSVLGIGTLIVLAMSPRGHR